MARTPSTMIPLGTPAPEFDLPDPSGGRARLQDFQEAPGLLVAFWCNHCPFVKHVRQGFVDFAREYQDRGLAVVAVNANDSTTHPADAPAEMVRESREHGFPFPYVVDESQAVAHAFGAACTPDFFLFDGEKRLVYRGQFDASRPGNPVPVSGRDLREACDAVLEGRTPSVEQVPSIGCNIKWKPGNAP